MLTVKSHTTFTHIQFSHPPDDNAIGVGGLHHEHRGVLLFGYLQKGHHVVTEPPPQLLLLAGGGVPPITVLILFSSTTITTTATPLVQDGPLRVVGHREVDGADVGEEVKVLQDVSGQFELANKSNLIYIYKEKYARAPSS